MIAGLTLWLCQVAAVPVQAPEQAPEQAPGEAPADGEIFAVVTPRGVVLDGAPLGEPCSHVALATSPDGARLATTGGVAGESGILRIWDVARRELVWERRVHDDLVHGVAWSPDGASLYTAGADRRVGVISADGEDVAYLEGHSDQVLAVAVSSRGTVATGCLDGTVRVWEDGATQRVLARHGDRVASLAFHPEGELLATGSADRTVRVWNASTGRMRAIVRDHDGVVLALAWSPEHLVSGCSDGLVRELDPYRARVLAVLHRHEDWVRGVTFVGQRVVSSDASGELSESLLSSGAAPR